ncbi:MAG: hypothetical protein IIW01_09735, partial [Thermoguttaceae bacterium]|nr:hypothetical protein [Thermoguttaceae bacterium]
PNRAKSRRKRPKRPKRSERRTRPTLAESHFTESGEKTQEEKRDFNATPPPGQTQATAAPPRINRRASFRPQTRRYSSSSRVSNF